MRAASAAILALRSEIFVVEQTCVFQDVDGLSAIDENFVADRAPELIAGPGADPDDPKLREYAYTDRDPGCNARGQRL